MKANDIIDLSYPIHPLIPTWSGEGVCAMKEERVAVGSDSEPSMVFCLQQYSMSAGVSTHIDAPSHCFPEKASVDLLALDQLVRPLVVIDTSQHCDPFFVITAKILREHERQYGKIPPHCHVICRTGWGSLWRTPHKYRNNCQFPSLSQDAAEFLLERKIVSLGVDTLSPDVAESSFPVHRLLLGNDVLIIENVAWKSGIPLRGATLGIFPLCIQGGAEAPCRLAAFVPKS